MNKKINVKLAAFRVGLLWLCVCVASVQTHVAANSKARTSQKQDTGTPASYTQAAGALHAIADTIKACPRVIEFDASKDSQESEGPLARSRLYYGPPVNVVWGLRRSNSIARKSVG